MQATVYISTEAMATVSAIINLDYYDRVSLGDDDPAADLTTSPGYYLNTNALQLAVLPADANIAMHITPADPTTFIIMSASPPICAAPSFPERRTCRVITPRSSTAGRRWFRPTFIGGACSTRTFSIRTASV